MFRKQPNSETDLPPESPEVLSARSIEMPAHEDGAAALLLRDRVLQVLLVLTLLVNLALFAYLAIRFEALPDLLPLHFDVAGFPDRIEPKSGIFGLPLIGFIVLFINGVFGGIVHRHQRAATLLLAASGLLVQILMWVAVINIAGGLG
ncbi:MAG: DUF1648 domain-containing protein [Chloroflexota bacterium]|nr:DUF1648 domain-containing protein [Chloroflexota bacterium]